MASNTQSTKIITFHKLNCPCCMKNVYHTDWISTSTWDPDVYKCKRCEAVFETTINGDNSVTYNITKEGISIEYCTDCSAIEISKDQQGKVLAFCGKLKFSIHPFRLSCETIKKKNNGGSK